jgi:hypothetical protein
MASDTGGIQVGDVGGDVTFSALGDFVGGDKVVNVTTHIHVISLEAIKTRPFQAASPYRGLERFEDRDHALFFGREAAVRSLLAKVSDGSTLLVLGPPGAASRHWCAPVYCPS